MLRWPAESAMMFANRLIVMKQFHTFETNSFIAPDRDSHSPVVVPLHYWGFWGTPRNLPNNVRPKPVKNLHPSCEAGMYCNCRKINQTR